MSRSKCIKIARRIATPLIDAFEAGVGDVQNPLTPDLLGEYAKLLKNSDIPYRLIRMPFSEIKNLGSINDLYDKIQSQLSPDAVNIVDTKIKQNQYTNFIDAVAFKPHDMWHSYFESKERSITSGDIAVALLKDLGDHFPYKEQIRSAADEEALYGLILGLFPDEIVKKLPVAYRGRLEDTAPDVAVAYMLSGNQVRLRKPVGLKYDEFSLEFAFNRSDANLFPEIPGFPNTVRIANKWISDEFDRIDRFLRSQIGKIVFVDSSFFNIY